jgi:hypothetical protein
MSALRTKRRIAFLAVAALLFASTMFLAHGYSDRAHKTAQCDLCLQFNGAAGAPAAASAISKPVQVTRQAVLPAQPIRVSQQRVDSRLPRGPPSNDLI